MRKIYLYIDITLECFHSYIYYKEIVSIDTCIAENRAKSVWRICAEGFNVKRTIATMVFKE